MTTEELHVLQYVSCITGFWQSCLGQLAPAQRFNDRQAQSAIRMLRILKRQTLARQKAVGLKAVLALTSHSKVVEVPSLPTLLSNSPIKGFASASTTKTTVSHQTAVSRIIATSRSGHRPLLQPQNNSFSTLSLHVRGQPVNLTGPLTDVQNSRAYGTVCKLKPKFQGGKLKISGAYKRRFKRLSSDDSIKMFPAGHSHRRFRKSKKQNKRLRTPNKMHHTYANTMKRMGFK